MPKALRFRTTSPDFLRVGSYQSLPFGFAVVQQAGARGSQDRAALEVNPGNVRGFQRDCVCVAVKSVGSEPTKTVVETDNLESPIAGFDGGGSDDRINTRRGTSTDDDSETFIGHRGAGLHFYVNTLTAFATVC